MSRMEPAALTRPLAAAARRRRLRWATLLLTAAAFLVAALLAPEADGFVYWANHATEGKILRADLNGQGQQVLAVTLAFPCGVAVDSNWVYWGQEGAGDGTTI